MGIFSLVLVVTGSSHSASFWISSRRSYSMWSCINCSVCGKREVQEPAMSPPWSWCSAGEKSGCKAGDPGSIPGSGRSPREGLGYPLQCSWASLVVQLVKILPATQETPVQSLDQEIPWGKKWQPTPVFLPGESNGQRSPVGYSPWGHKSWIWLSD